MSGKQKTPILKPTATAYLQVFGTGCGDTNPSIYLFADSQRYIFNCGEATQRLFHEHKLRMGKINNLFFTQISWDFIGGCPGLLLTLRDSGKREIGLHGPCGLSQFFESTRSFVLTPNLQITCTEYAGENSHQYKDENIIVTPIYLEGKETDSFSYDSNITEIQDLTTEADTCITTESVSSKLDTNCTKDNAPDSHEMNPAKRCKLDVRPKPVVSYICELTQQHGKFNAKKAKALGVPAGPLFGQLQKGQAVTLPDGSVVKSTDVIGGSAENTCVFCIIDCPTKHYFDSLITNKQLVIHETGGSKPQPTIMIHLSPATLVVMSEYSKWTKRFGESCQHLFLNADMPAPKHALLSQLRIQYRLHNLDGDIFPRLFGSDVPNMEIKQYLNENWKAAESFLVYHLRPAHRQGYDYSDITAKWDKLRERLNVDKTDHSTGSVTNTIPNNNECTIEDFINPDLYFKSKDSLLSKTMNVVSESERVCNKDEDFEVVFLGTGACLPSKYRNVSSTLVRIGKEKFMLLDCGEGTYGQLFRHYGPDLEEILPQICCVFISHIHADHHLGLIKVFQVRERCVKTSQGGQRSSEPILVVGPPSIYSWLHSYGTFFETLNFRFVDCVKCQNEEFIGIKTVCTVLKSTKVSIVPVIHCFHAFGLVLTHTKGWKLVYSGDTRPCRKLIDEGRGATVLIHEATFEDNLDTEAKAKAHCTTTEAIECGQKMRAELILLTHFSQRYAKIPVFNKKYSDRTGVAFDHMKVNFRNIARVPKLPESLQDVLKDELDELVDIRKPEEKSVEPVPV